MRKDPGWLPLLRVLERERNLYLLDDDRILFVFDFPNRLDVPLADSFYGWDYQIQTIPAVTRPSMDYVLDTGAIDGVTVLWLATSQSITHSAQTREMMERGVYVISNPNIQDDWLPLLTKTSRRACIRNARRALDVIEIEKDVTSEMRITSDDGTDLVLSLAAMNWKPETGQRIGRRTNGVFGELINVPFDANGTYVLMPNDFITNPINRIVKAKGGIKITIEHNCAVDISGGGEADTLRQILSAAGDPLAFHLGECSLGINPARPKKVFCSTVAEKLTGGVHIALGTPMGVNPESPDIGKFRYGTGYSAGVHMDLIKFGADVAINGREFVRYGRWLLN